VTQRPAERSATRTHRLRRLLPLAATGASALFAVALGGSLVALAATPTSFQVLVADGTSGTVYVTDAGAATAIAEPTSVTGGVQSLAISPDGSRVYVAFKDGLLGVIDTTSDSYLGAPLDLGSTSALGQMVVTPNGRDLYVAESGPGQVVEVDTSTDAVVGSPMATGPAVNLAITPDGTSLFVDGGGQSSAISVIATASNTLSSTTISVAAPGAMQMSADGAHLYVVSGSSAAPELTVIDPATDAVEGSPIMLPATSQPAGLALNADGTVLYVTDASGQLVDSVDPATGTLNTTPEALPTGFTPRDIAITSDGAIAYVDGTNTAGASELVVVDLASGSAGVAIPLTGATQPAGLVIAPLAPTPDPTPTPTPSPSCNPILPGSLQTGSSHISTSPAATVSGSAVSTAAPAETPNTAPSTTPTSAPVSPSPQVTLDCCDPILTPSPIQGGPAPSPPSSIAPAAGSSAGHSDLPATPTGAPTANPSTGPSATPSATASPTCSACSPIMIGPMQGVPGKAARLPEPASGSGTGAAVPIGTASSSPSSMPPGVILPPVPTVAPTPGGSPGFGPGPVICFGAAALPGLARSDVSLANETAASSVSNLSLARALVVLALAVAGTALMARRYLLKLPRLSRWRNSR